MKEVIQQNVSVGDFVLVDMYSDGVVVAQVLSGTEDTVTCQQYTTLTADTIIRYSLQPIVGSIFPVASQTNIVELVGTSSTCVEERSAIVDVAFVVTIHELESGLVHLTGASKIYFARFGFLDEHRLCQIPPSLYFSVQFVAPFTFRLFSALNMLAQNLKRVLYFVPESCEPKKVFHVFFPTDAFHYLCA